MDIGFERIVTIIAAFVGMLLGIYNFYISKKKEKVRLKVIPKTVIFNGMRSDGQEAHITTPHKFNIDNASQYSAIEVINLSDFNITISNVGYCSSSSKERLTVSEPIMQDGNEWPRKLETRESVMIYVKLKSLLTSKIRSNLTHAFAETSCDNISKGTSEAFRQMINLK